MDENKSFERSASVMADSKVFTALQTGIREHNMLLFDIMAEKLQCRKRLQESVATATQPAEYCNHHYNDEGDDIKGQ